MFLHFILLYFPFMPFNSVYHYTRKNGKNKNKMNKLFFSLEFIFFVWFSRFSSFYLKNCFYVSNFPLRKNIGLFKESVEKESCVGRNDVFLQQNSKVNCDVSVIAFSLYWELSHVCSERRKDLLVLFENQQRLENPLVWKRRSESRSDWIEDFEFPCVKSKATVMWKLWMKSEFL